MQKDRVVRFLAGHRAAARRVAELHREEGSPPDQAVAELFAALEVALDSGWWPGPRDPVSEASAERLRRRWAMVQGHARQARSR